MSYEQQNWVTGNRITAEKLNHIEQGISSAGGSTPLIVKDNYDESTNKSTLDRTWQEIYDAFIGGRNVLLGTTDHPLDVDLLTTVSELPVSSTDTLFKVVFGGELTYSAMSADSYPVFGNAR